MPSVCCGIVTFNPDIERLASNLAAASPQVDKIFIYDNGSQNITEIVQLSGSFNCRVNRSGNNSGMAVALNSLANTAVEYSYDYIFFLDQDSIAEKDMVETLLGTCAEDVGIVSPKAIDRNEFTKEDYLPHVAEIHNTITSGSLVNLKAFKAVGGYDERLFVDWVDIDFCHNLRLHGYRILRTKGAVLLHELGHKEYVMKIPRKDPDGKRRLRRYYRTNHSMFRQEDKTRSQTIVLSKYKSTPIFKEVLLPIISSNVFDLLLEKHKIQLVKAKIRGVKRGLEILKESRQDKL